MNPTQLSKALVFIANKIDNSTRPSRLALINDINTIIANLSLAAKPKFTPEGDIVRTPKTPSVPSHQGPEFKPTVNEKYRDFGKIDEDKFLKQDTETLEELTRAGIFKHTPEFKCSRCGKSFGGYNPGLCGECEVRAKRREIIDIREGKIFTYDPEINPIVDVAPYKRVDSDPKDMLMRFMRYLDKQGRTYFTFPEADALANMSTLEPGKVVKQRSIIIDNLKESGYTPKGSAPAPTRYKSLNDFVQSKESDNEKSYTEFELRQLADSIQTGSGKLLSEEDLEALWKAVRQPNSKIKSPQPPKQLPGDRSGEGYKNAIRKYRLDLIKAILESNGLILSSPAGKIDTENEVFQDIIGDLKDVNGKLLKNDPVGMGKLVAFIEENNLKTSLKEIPDMWSEHLRQEIANRLFGGDMDELRGSLLGEGYDLDDMTGDELTLDFIRSILNPPPVPREQTMSVLLKKPIKEVEDALAVLKAGGEDVDSMSDEDLEQKLKEIFRAPKAVEPSIPTRAVPKPKSYDFRGLPQLRDAFFDSVRFIKKGDVDEALDKFLEGHIKVFPGKAKETAAKINAFKRSNPTGDDAIKFMESIDKEKINVDQIAYRGIQKLKDLFFECAKIAESGKVVEALTKYSSGYGKYFPQKAEAAATKIDDFKRSNPSEDDAIRFMETFSVK